MLILKVHQVVVVVGGEYLGRFCKWTETPTTLLTNKDVLVFKKNMFLIWDLHTSDVNLPLVLNFYLIRK